MIFLDDAIRALNPTIVTILGEQGFDSNHNLVTYDLSAAQTKLTEMQQAEATAQQTLATEKASALSKLTALGLTQAEITALIG